jgi:hypothetical protein
MRTSSFSNDRIIKIIRQYFIPVWVSNDDYGIQQKQQAEADELRRIRQLADRNHLVTGSVNVYLVDSEGNPFTSMGVAKAMEAQNLLPMLERVVRDRDLKPRDPDAVQALANHAPPGATAKTPDGLVLHVWSRYLPPGEVEKGTTDDWVEWTKDEWTTLLPPPGSRVGSSWDIPRSVTDKVLSYCYPPVCEYKVASSKMREAKLVATLSAQSTRETHISLSATLDLDHSRDGKIDGRVTAHLIGLVRYDPAQRKITSLQMVSTKADYQWHWDGRAANSRIGIVVESVSK